MTDVREEIEAVVEDTELPKRLKDRIYETIAERAETVDAEAAEAIVTAVENQYRDSRVDPLDPVGTVSAQSIGEPGTQMSLPADERVIVRREGRTEVAEIGPLVDTIVESHDSREIGDHEVARAPEDMQVPSLGHDEQVRWKAVQEVSRHEAPEELLRFDLESGRSIRTTKAHSFVTRRANEVVPVAGDDLEVGDWLPVVSDLEVEEPSEELDLREYLPADQYWYTSALTDGGVARVPGGDDQLRNKRAALESGELEEHAIYPKGGTVSLPEALPLDAETGFFIGAWLAEGSLAEGYVSISNVDDAFQDRIRSFANRFGLTTHEYENESGFARGYDIRVNGTVLVDLLRATCITEERKVVPEFAFGASDEFVMGLLRGYLSGDGSVSDTAVRATSRSDRLVEGIALLLTRVGVYARLGRQGDSRSLRIPKKFVPDLADHVGGVGERGDAIRELAADIDGTGPDVTDQIPNFGDAIETVAAENGIPSRRFNSATERQRIGRNRLEKLVEQLERPSGDTSPELAALRQAVDSDVVWERIDSITTVSPEYDHVYDFSVDGLETFTTAQGVVTHNTMNTFHYAGVAEIDVTQGLPRLIELVDARKEPDTPMMTVHLEDEYATEREKAHEVVWKIEATRILALGDVSTNVADMLVRIDLNDDTLAERWPTVDDLDEIAGSIAETIESRLGVETERPATTVIEFGPEQPSYRELLQLVEELRDIVFKGISDISRVVIRKEETDDGDEEFVLYTEGSAFGKVLDIDGVDASRTTCNNIHEIHSELGIEAAREAIIEETMNTLEEQGLDDVNVRHLMLVADIMTNRGTIESIGRHGISGNKESVLARAAFEVTVSHLLDAAVHGEVDDLNGVTENVIVGKPIKLGTGDVDLRMGARQVEAAEQGDD